MTAADIDPRHLRAAIEFAVLMAREGRKFKPPLEYPKALDKHLRTARIPTAALASLRRVIERDERFRTRIAAGALPELVDPIGRVWLERPAGWEAELERLAAAAEAAADEADTARQLQRAEKRRHAAEQATVRAQAELVVLHEQVAERDRSIDDLRADVAKLTERVDELRAELTDARVDARHARDREAAAVDRVDRLERERDAARHAQHDAEGVRDHVLADRSEEAVDRSELTRLAATAQAVAHRLSDLAAVPSARAPARRTPLALPGGVLGDSEAGAEHLLRSGATVLVDGYNVAKLGWPRLDLATQRAVLLDAVENLARRYGSDLTVVFDGADVVGAAADRRRVVRVVFSPADVIADDVIRDEVGRLPVARPVVVVTNDQAIVRDVRAAGANTITSNTFLSLLR